MPRLEVYGHPHHRREDGRIVRYEVGQQFDGGERELRNMPDRLRRVGQAPTPAPESEPDEHIETDDDHETDELTKAQLIKMAEDLDVWVDKTAKKADIKEVIDDAIASM